MRSVACHRQPFSFDSRQPQNECAADRKFTDHGNSAAHSLRQAPGQSQPEPAAMNLQKRKANQSELAKKIIEWRAKIEESWEEVGFGSLNYSHAEGKERFEVEVFLGNLDPSDVRVELFANGDPPLKCEMSIARNSDSGYLYSAAFDSASQDSGRVTPRIFPFHPDVSIPLELAKVKWQK